MTTRAIFVSVVFLAYQLTRDSPGGSSILHCCAHMVYDIKGDSERDYTVQLSDSERDFAVKLKSHMHPEFNPVTCTRVV